MPPVRPLQQILKDAVETNLDSVELEYVSEGLEVRYMSNNTGFGSVITDDKTIRSIIGDIIDGAGLEKSTKGKMSITLHGQARTIRVEEWENFGEPAFRLYLQ